MPDNSGQKGFVLLELIITIAVLAAAGYFVAVKKFNIEPPSHSPSYSYSSVPNPSPHISPYPSQKPIVGNCQIPPSHKTYINSEYGFSVEYPNSWSPSGITYANAFEIRTDHPEIKKSGNVVIVFGEKASSDNEAAARLATYQNMTDYSGFNIQKFQIQGRRAVYVTFKTKAATLGRSILPGATIPPKSNVLIYRANLVIVDGLNIIEIDGTAMEDQDPTIFCDIEAVLKSASFSNQDKTQAILKGHITLGPFCPVEMLNSPCSVPSGAYSGYSIVATEMDHEPNTGGNTAVAKIDSSGDYDFDSLRPGTYIVEFMSSNSIARSTTLPKTITLSSGQSLRLDISIDTGIR